jgi:hypothetical protein
MHLPVRSEAMLGKPRAIGKRRQLPLLERGVFRRSRRLLGGLAATVACISVVTLGTPSNAVGRSFALQGETQSDACGTPSDWIIDYLDSVVVSGDSVFGILPRARLHLPVAPISSVSVVTDSTICHRGAVAAGLSRSTPDSLAFTRVSVIKVGATRYIVITSAYAGEWRIGMTFDSAFTVPPPLSLGQLRSRFPTMLVGLARIIAKISREFFSLRLGLRSSPAARRQ